MRLNVIFERQNKGCIIVISGGDGGSGFAPSFIEKPRIIPNESGTLITLRCICSANPKPEVTWFKGTKMITETSKISMKVTDQQENTYEILLLIQVNTLFYYALLILHYRRHQIV